MRADVARMVIESGTGDHRIDSFVQRGLEELWTAFIRDPDDNPVGLMEERK